MKVTFGIIIICYVIALFIYDLLKNFLKKAFHPLWWKFWLDTPHRLWLEWMVQPAQRKHWRGVKSCRNCAKSCSKNLGAEGWAEPECKRFQSKWRSKWTNEYKERECKDFEKNPKF